MGLILKQVPARQGLAWVRQGIAECLRHPLRYLALFATFMLVSVPVSLVPVVGQVLILMGIPLLSLAYMMAVVGSQRGQPPALAVFGVPWQKLPKERRRHLLVLCLAYAFLTLVSLSLCELIDHGGLEAYIAAAAAGNPDPAELQKLASAPGVVAGAMARMLVTGLLGIPFWHAPALVVWGEQGPAQALFSSTLALWRTRGAFLLYILGWIAVVMSVALVMGVVMLVGLGALAPWLMMPMALLITSAYYVSFFFTFRDSFGAPSSEGTGKPDAGDAAAGRPDESDRTGQA